MNKIESLVKRFYMKNFPELLNVSGKTDDEVNSLHGKLQAKIAFSEEDLKFFEKHYNKEEDNDLAYSAFKNQLYGIGKSKFRYNEHNLKDFDHSVCKNLNDIIYFHQMTQHKVSLELENFDDGVNEENYMHNTCTWIYTEASDGTPTPYSIVDVYAHVWWKLEAISYDIFEEIMKPKEVNGPMHGLIDEESGMVYYDILVEYENDVYRSMEEDMLEATRNISNNMALTIANSMKDKKQVFFKSADGPEDGNTIIVPSIEVAKNFDINDFEDSLSKGYIDERLLHDLVYFNITENVKMLMKDEFHKLYHKHLNSIDIFKNKKKNTASLMSQELFNLMKDGEIED